MSRLSLPSRVRRRPRGRLAALCLGLLFPAAAFFALADAGAESGMRMWTHADGDRTILATLEGRGNGTVTLKRSDGREFTIDENQLSEGDREFLASLDAPPGLASGVLLARAIQAIPPGSSTVQVERGLAEHADFTSTFPEALRGRTGLSGLYSCLFRGRRFTLFLEFAKDGGLVASNLRGDGHPDADACREEWEIIREDLYQGLGDSMHRSDFPAAESFRTGQVVISDVWRSGENFLTLGVARTADGWSVLLDLTRRSPLEN